MSGEGTKAPQTRGRGRKGTMSEEGTKDREIEGETVTNKIGT